MTTVEIWKDIPEFENWYQASTLGNIRSVDRYVNYKTTGQAFKKGKVLCPKKSNKGYLEVVLVKNGKYFYKRVHQLVAITFIPNPCKYNSINHINEIKTDNRVSNLEWCTQKDNSDAYVRSRINVFQYDLNGKLVKIWHSISNAAKSVSGDKTGIQHCCAGKLKTYKNYIWSYCTISSEDIKSRKTNNNCSKVIQIDLNGNILHSYNSMAEAAKSVGCNPSAISMACLGIRKTIKGYIWKRRV